MENEPKNYLGEFKQLFITVFPYASDADKCMLDSRDFNQIEEVIEKLAAEIINYYKAEEVQMKALEAEKLKRMNIENWKIVIGPFHNE
jgi:predicted amidophosphoribosyltransferase